MAYYYLISSLPMLKADGAIPLSYDRFLELCQGALEEDKYRMLKELTLSSGKGPLVSEWAEFYGTLKDELTYQRNLRLGRKAKLPDVRNDSVSKTVTLALNSKNPLAAEEMLLDLEFKKLDELVGVHYFDDYALFGYALKLKLLERKNSFDKEQGKAEFGRIVTRLEDEITNM